MPPSACLPWQTDTPGQTAEERNEGARSYTTVRGTIRWSLRYGWRRRFSPALVSPVYRRGCHLKPDLRSGSDWHFSCPSRTRSTGGTGIATENPDACPNQQQGRLAKPGSRRLGPLASPPNGSRNRGGGHNAANCRRQAPPGTDPRGRSPRRLRCRSGGCNPRTGTRYWLQDPSRPSRRPTLR
jgi:hypothetical protein